MCVLVWSFWVDPIETLCYLDLDVYFSRLGKFSAIMSGAALCLFYPSFWDLFNENVDVLDVVPET